METQEVWLRAPQSAEFFERLFHEFATQNPLIERLEARFLDVAGVRMQSLVDHWILPEDPELRAQLPKLGFVEVTLPEGDKVWQHPGVRLPHLRFKQKRVTPCLALLVENASDFSTAHNLNLDACHGDEGSTYQCAHLTLESGELMPIVRNGYSGYAPGTLSNEEREALIVVRERLANRNRSGEESLVIAQTHQLIEEAIALVGRDRTADEFFLAERNYYLTRNSAARWQLAQQSSLGISWANQDHHTYRSSRASFRSLISLFNTMGFIARERFYAGIEAGWGAQVMEHPISRVVIFADVDIAPEELDIDFANTYLPEREDLGTIGLWCALHTSSIAEAGMHHLECEYDFERANALLNATGHPVMPPFTDLPMLKQAFTVAETWKVAPERAQMLVMNGAITPEQAQKFILQGAAGSHLEILQRWEGFKGFNKTGVSAIIRDTDARKQQ